jgi:hypothetical protein
MRGFSRDRMQTTERTSCEICDSSSAAGVAGSPFENPIKCRIC